MAGEIEFSERKFKDLLLYIADQLGDDPTFGETKLNKALFYADMETYRLLGRPITGAEYQKNKFGPTARLYPVMRDELLRTDQATVERRLVVDHVQDVVHPKVRANVEQFTDAEREIVDRVVEDLRGQTNTEVSDESHVRSAGWHLKEMGETVPYSTWLIDTTPADDEAEVFLKRLEGITT